MCWLGGNLIVNGYANETIRRVFERAGSLREGIVEITPDDGPVFVACVEGNPFGRGVVSPLGHHAEELSLSASSSLLERGRSAILNSAWLSSSDGRQLLLRRLERYMNDEL